MPRGEARKTNVHSWTKTIGPQFKKVSDLNKQLLIQMSKLLKVSTGEIPHIYDGLCPDNMEEFETRDPECKACQILCESETLITENNALI